MACYWQFHEIWFVFKKLNNLKQFHGKIRFSFQLIWQSSCNFMTSSYEKYQVSVMTKIMWSTWQVHTWFLGNVSTRLRQWGSWYMFSDIISSQRWRGIDRTGVGESTRFATLYLLIQMIQWSNFSLKPDSYTKTWPPGPWFPLSFFKCCFKLFHKLATFDQLKQEPALPRDEDLIVSWRAHCLKQLQLTK